MQRRYITADVFTERVFSGNPLAVVLDAQGLSTSQMQSIATEFNYAETTFVLPPRSAAHMAHVRIFTARVEVPFAGHPTIGTAVMLAQESETGAQPDASQYIFEMAAGDIAVQLLRERGLVVGAELRAPEPLSLRDTVSVERTAACLSLSDDDVSIAAHIPQVISVGLPFLVAELKTRDALRRARPVLALHEEVLPRVGTDSIYAYVRGPEAGSLHSRAFMPMDGTVEDAATGSATAATIALLASLGAEPSSDLSWRVEQGVDMGRPSVLLGRTRKRDGTVTDVYIAGKAVRVMRGVLALPSL